jgi:3-hydroxyisobutyrate dehydrogenase
VGATEEQFARWRPVLEVMGREPVRVGPVGKAASLKLALNQLIGSLTVAFSFSLGLVRREGIDTELFMKILKGSALFAPSFERKLPLMLARDFTPANFPAKHLHKDLGLAVERARTLGLETRVVEAARAVLAETLAQGRGDEDYSALYEAVDPAG